MPLEVCKRGEAWQDHVSIRTLIDVELQTSQKELDMHGENWAWLGFLALDGFGIDTSLMVWCS
jgi:hypothetical protein